MTKYKDQLLDECDKAFRQFIDQNSERVTLEILGMEVRINGQQFKPDGDQQQERLRGQ